MTLLKKKNTSLGEKLKVAVSDLSIDLFGYDKIISIECLEEFITNN